MRETDLIIDGNAPIPTAVAAFALRKSESALRKEAKAGLWPGAFERKGRDYTWKWSAIQEVSKRRMQA